MKLCCEKEQRVCHLFYQYNQIAMLIAYHIMRYFYAPRITFGATLKRSFLTFEV